MFARGYAKYYDLFNAKKPYEKEVDFVYKWAGFPSRILDIGCGTASYWKFYPSQVSLFGIESSPSMRIQSDINFRLGGRIVRGDITNFKHTNCMDFDCVIALFDVINYIPEHGWWKKLPLRRGGSFIFDILDKKKIDKEGFRKTRKKVGAFIRTITPECRLPGENIDLSIDVTEAVLDHTTDTELFNNVVSEIHRLHLYSHDDIKRFCGKEFEIVEVKPTKRWQCWYKLRRK